MRGIYIAHFDFLIKNPRSREGSFFREDGVLANCFKKCVVKGLRVVTIGTGNAETNRYDEWAKFDRVFCRSDMDEAIGAGDSP